MYDEKEFNKRTDNEKLIKQLGDIEMEVGKIWVQIDGIDTLLKAEIVQLLRNLNQTIVVFNKWVISLAVVFLVLKYL